MITPMRWLLLALVVASPAQAFAQRPTALDKLRALSLDTTAGTVPVHYSRGQEPRARHLQMSYAAAVEHYETVLPPSPAVGINVRLALLSEADWSAVSPRPYATPYIDFTSWPELVVLLPSQPDRGLLAGVWQSVRARERFL